MQIITAGRGALAQIIEAACAKQKKKNPVNHRRFTPEMHLEEESAKTILLYCTHDRELLDALDFCRHNQVIMLQASTTLTVPIPEDPGCPVIHVPNLCFGVIQSFAIAERMTEAYAMVGIKPIEIWESHRVTKSPGSGTARRLAQAVGLSEQDIKSVRNAGIQRGLLNIAEKNLETHAYHAVIFQGLHGQTYEHWMKVPEREAYGTDGIEIARQALTLWDELKAGVYPAEEILGRADERLHGKN